MVCTSVPLLPCLTLKLQTRDVHTPSKHSTITLCWFNVGPASQTMGQHQAIFGSSSVFAGELFSPLSTHGVFLQHMTYCEQVNIGERFIGGLIKNTKNVLIDAPSIR